MFIITTSIATGISTTVTITFLTRLPAAKGRAKGGVKLEGNKFAASKKIGGSQQYEFDLKHIS